VAQSIDGRLTGSEKGEDMTFVGFLKLNSVAVVVFRVIDLFWLGVVARSS